VSERTAESDAEIVDVAYTRLHGPRTGQAAATLSLMRFGALRALGARRGWRAKVIPIALIFAALGPALVVLGVRALFSEFTDRAPIDIADVLPYAEYQSLIGVVILVFAVILASDLLCPDRRDGVLSLYFSTSVGRDQYVLGRFLGAAVPLLLVTLAPMLVLFAGNAFFDDAPLDYVGDEWAQVARIAAAGVLLAAYYAAVALAVSAFTSRRAYAVGAYALLMVASTTVAVLVQEALGRARFLELAALSSLPIMFARAIFPETADQAASPLWAFALAYAAVVGASVALLLRRYRRERV
jgi:ABC-2 type transport system permease protein